MKMSVLGKIEVFSGKAEDLECYIERLEQFLCANDLEKIVLVDDGNNREAVNTRTEKHRAVFLSVIGPSAYTVLRNLVSPDKPTDKTMEQLVQLLCMHYNPQHSVAVLRYKFHSRSRQQGESVASYVSNPFHTSTVTPWRPV